MKLKDSFADKNLVYVFVVELIFLLILSGSFFAWQSVLTSQADNLFLTYGNINNVGLGQVESFMQDFRGFVFYLIILSIVFFLIFFYGWGVSRSLVWSRLLEEKINKKIVLRSVTLKFLWVLIWSPLIALFLVPLFVLSSAVQVNPLAVTLYQGIIAANFILWLIIAYFGLFLYRSYFTQHKIYPAITEAFRDGLKNIKKMALPILAVIIIFIILYFITININILILNLVLILYVYTATRIYLISKVIHYNK